jgi:hypothetical protein
MMPSASSVARLRYSITVKSGAEKRMVLAIAHGGSPVMSIFDKNLKTSIEQGRLPAVTRAEKDARIAELEAALKDMQLSHASLEEENATLSKRVTELEASQFLHNFYLDY